jgi:hypothetical protein
MKPKVALTKQQQIEHWVQQYLSAKAKGDTRVMKLCEAIIKKLDGKIPRL